MADSSAASRFGRKLFSISLSAAWGVLALLSVLPPRGGLTWHLPAVVSVGMAVMALYSWWPNIKDAYTSVHPERHTLVTALAPWLAYLLYLTAFAGALAFLGAVIVHVALDNGLDPRTQMHAAAGIGVAVVAIGAWRVAQRLDKRERHQKIRPALTSVDSSLKHAMDALSSARDDLVSLEKELESKADSLDRRNASLAAHEAALKLDPEAAKRVAELHRLGDMRAFINTAVQVAIGFAIGIVTPFVTRWLEAYFQLSP